jgi:uncharacterized protein
MILRFGVGNYCSIRDYQEISFAAAPIKDRDANLLHVSGLRTPVLPALAIYGSNAAGKSTLLAALDFMKSGILRSHSREQAGDPINVDPFRLDPKFAKRPSRFDCDFVIDRVRYHYGFVVTRQAVVEEWLYAYSLTQTRKTRQTWFHRSARNRVKFYFGSELKGKNKTIEALTRKDSLFLSTAAQNNHDQLLPIYSFFRDRVTVIKLHASPDTSLFATYLRDAKAKQWILDVLRLADTGITDAHVQVLKPPKNVGVFRDDLAALLKKHIGEELPLADPSEMVDVRLVHKGRRGNVPLSLNDESAGTLVLLEFLGPVYDALSKGGLLVVDELNTSMHTLVSRKLVNLFGSQRSNTGAGQLLFATHDTNLLLDGVLRRDQVWFVEKTPEGVSRFYPLTDIRTRQTDNIERGYLEGRFGAIPFLGTATF